jgi:small nuclear ribonucleoprotein E
MPPKRVKKVMTLPINVIFSHLQVRSMDSCECEMTGYYSSHEASLTHQLYHIHFHFSHYQKKTRVRLGLYEDKRLLIEGQIIGFDEYMNMVLEDAVEIDSKKNKRVEVGRILLKGDSITMLQEAQPVRPAAPREVE